MARVPSRAKAPPLRGGVWLSDSCQTSLEAAFATHDHGALRANFDFVCILVIIAAERQSSPGNGVFQATNPEHTVTKYSLALMSPQNSESDVRVGEFPGAERAFQLAELIALDLSIEVDGKWRGWTVEVRSAQGRKLFAVPVVGDQLH
jgi:hypothetical protein